MEEAQERRAGRQYTAEELRAEREEAAATEAERRRCGLPRLDLPANSTFREFLIAQFSAAVARLAAPLIGSCVVRGRDAAPAYDEEEEEEDDDDEPAPAPLSGAAAAPRSAAAWSESKPRPAQREEPPPRRPPPAPPAQRASRPPSNTARPQPPERKYYEYEEINPLPIPSGQRPRRANRFKTAPPSRAAPASSLFGDGVADGGPVDGCGL